MAGSVSRAARVVALLSIAMLIATLPLGTVWHVLHDHFDDHAHVSDAAGLHVADADHGDHDADHLHLWMTPASAVAATPIASPAVVAALDVPADLAWRSAVPLPPFSPPRA